MLDVNFVSLVARKCHVQSMQMAFGLIIQQFLAIEKIGCPMLFAEKEPIASARTFQEPLLQEGAEWSDAGARAAHDDVATVVFRQAEGAGFLDVNRNALHKHSRMVGEKPGSQTFLGTPVSI